MFFSIFLIFFLKFFSRHCLFLWYIYYMRTYVDTHPAVWSDDSPAIWHSHFCPWKPALQAQIPHSSVPLAEHEGELRTSLSSAWHAHWHSGFTSTVTSSVSPTARIVKNLLLMVDWFPGESGADGHSSSSTVTFHETWSGLGLQKKHDILSAKKKHFETKQTKNDRYATTTVRTAGYLQSVCFGISKS